MQIIDSKTTYLDDAGKPLSGGRLRFFAYGTTNPVFVYADADYIANLGTTVALTNAGWTATQVYANQSVNVHVDKFLGLDEFGAESYEQIKVYDVLVSVSGPTGADSAIIDTISELRNVSPTSKAAVSVKGYYEAGDVFIRTYIWDENSSAVDNLGTVIESSVEPIGRWLLGIEGPYVDSRIFGVMPGLQTVNSAFAQHLAYCSTYKKIAYYVSGSFYLTSGGSLTVNCGIKSSKGTVINSESGTYTLTVNNPNFDIVDTFSGTGIDLFLSGDGWENTIVPVTAFIGTAYCKGTAHYKLRINSASALTFDTGFLYSEIIVDSGITVPITVNSGVEVNARTISGLGKVAYQTSNTFYVDYLHTSRLSGREGYAMDRTLKVVYVETNITMPPGIDISASIVDAGGSITNGPMTQGGSITTLRGAIDCRPGFLRGTVGFKLFGTIDVQKFNNAELAVKTWVFSEESYPELNMMGITATFNITRSGTIRNGTIIGKLDTDYLRLYDVNQNGNITLNSLIGEGCDFTCNSYNVGGGSLKRCALNHTSTTAPAPNMQNHVLEDFTTNYPYLRVLEGGAVWRNVNCNHVRLIPGNNFGNFDWVGGSADSVTFDASVATVNGTFTAYNVTIKQLKNLSGNVNSVNGSTKTWATSGHYNIQIGDNESGKRTYGSCDVPITHTGSYYGSNWRAYIGYLNKLFCFNTGETSLVAWSARAYKAAELGCHFETMTETTVDRSKNGEFHLWTQRFNTLEGKRPDNAHITFKVY